MPKARSAVVTSAPRRYLRALAGALALWPGALDPASARAPYDNAGTAEGWAWSRIKQGKRADFNQHCGAQSPLDPKNGADPRWRDDCRHLSARFLQDLLTRAPSRETAPFAGVRIAGARIAGDIDLENAKLIRPVEIAGSRIEGAIKLSHARTDSLIALDGSLMVGDFSADGLQGENDLYLTNGAAFEGAVTLTGARIDGDVDMTGARFDGALNANSLQVGGSLHMRDAHYADKVAMLFALIGTHLDLRGATLAGLNLSGASVAGDFRLGGGSYKSVVWKGKNGEPGALDLRNTHIGNLMDAKDAWPAPGRLRLDGFIFSDFGGYEGETGPQMRQRGAEWWDKNWARLDPDYSPVPYTQLAAALTTSGDPDAANEVRYLSRVRERETEKGLSFVWLSVLQWVAGFGIGSYSFRVLYWVVGVSFLGALYLRTRVKGVRDGRHGFFRCFGASLARLLPVIEINKEFTAFFNDPKRERLTGWQSFVFSTIRIMGWVFGLILLAAISGLTQSS